jgi:hypothetical protein
VYEGRGGAGLWVWAETTDRLRSAAQTLAWRPDFPEIR